MVRGESGNTRNEGVWVREKKNENDNRERTKVGIVLSVDRMEMEGKSENTAKASQGCGKGGRPLLPLLQTTSLVITSSQINPLSPVNSFDTKWTRKRGSKKNVTACAWRGASRQIQEQ